MTEKKTVTVINLNPTSSKRPKGPHYVNNKDFYDALVEYKRLRLEAIEKELPEPRIPDYIGKCIYLIANKLANAPNFYSYSYKDEMIADGIEDAILRLKSFDPDVSTNPFSYFTQICWFAAIRRIKKEQKQTTVKSELIKNSGILNSVSEQQDSDDAAYNNDYVSFLQENLIEDKTPDSLDQQTTIIFKKTTKAHQKRIAQIESDKMKNMDMTAEDIKNIGVETVAVLDYNKSYENEVDELVDVVEIINGEEPGSFFDTHFVWED